ARRCVCALRSALLQLAVGSPHLALDLPGMPVELRDDAVGPEHRRLVIALAAPRRADATAEVVRGGARRIERTEGGDERQDRHRHDEPWQRTDRPGRWAQ